jgi:hypothetical protein
VFTEMRFIAFIFAVSLDLTSAAVHRTMSESGHIIGVCLCVLLIVEVLGLGTGNVIGEFWAQLALYITPEFTLLLLSTVHRTRVMALTDGFKCNGSGFGTCDLRYERKCSERLVDLTYSRCDHLNLWISWFSSVPLNK